MDIALLLLVAGNAIAAPTGKSILAGDTCVVLPENKCFHNSDGRIDSIEVSAKDPVAECCAACNANKACQSWDTNDRKKRKKVDCNMYKNVVGVTSVNDGCRGGCAVATAAECNKPIPPAPPPPPPHPSPGPPPPPIPTCPSQPGGQCPNIVFLIDESTDGQCDTRCRTYRDHFAPTNIPNLKGLAKRGVQFDTHYVNAPVCCPSRASIWSGRQPHKINHTQAENPSLYVRGAWNNYEGNPPGYNDLIGDVMQRRGYAVQISGKTDWSAGEHSLNVRLNSWTMYTQFPYSINKTGGWYDEDGCPSDGEVAHNQDYYRHSDWKVVNSTLSWIKNHASVQKQRQLDSSAAAAAASAAAATAAAATAADGITAPRAGSNKKGSNKDNKDNKDKPNNDGKAVVATQPFFAYQGMNIVHPAYATNDYWLAKINVSEVTVPYWPPLTDLHPCDFQSSILKDCTPSDDNAAAFYSEDRRRRIRTIYYAMIAEYDAMVGKYVELIDSLGLTPTTWFVCTSDHGDMNMEHQQFYKMVQYDASSRVPLIIAGPGAKSGLFITAPTQHVDMFPTLAALAEVPHEQLPSVLDGESLVPYLSGPAVPGGTHKDFVISQFHGCNIAMSWFLATNGTYKYVVFGTGKEVVPQLFNLINDPGEMNNVATAHPDVVKTFDAKLRLEVDYPSVATDVADYNQKSFAAWTKRTPDWQDVLVQKGLRWDTPFEANKKLAMQAIATWQAGEPEVKACRKDLVWPPTHDEM